MKDIKAAYPSRKHLFESMLYLFISTRHIHVYSQKSEQKERRILINNVSCILAVAVFLKQSEGGGKMHSEYLKENR